MAERRIEIFGFGQCTVDLFAPVDAFAEPDSKAEFSGLETACGGPVATALWTLAAWGRGCAFSGVVGDDDAGGRITAELAAAGIDTSRVIVRPGGRSQFAFIAVERGGRRTIYWQRPTGAPPAPGEVDAPPCEVFLTDGLYAEPSLRFAERARSVVVDAGTLRDGTRALLDVAEVFVSSEGFARDFAGADDPAGACRKMHEHGVAVAGVTLGERGYVASFDGRVIERPAHPAEAVDTTGCGDVFHAGLVEGLRRGWPWEKTFDFAAWAAAGCAAAIGGRAGVPDAEAYRPDGYA